MSHPVNVATMLARAAALHGERSALRHGGRRITYRELDELTARLGSALLRRGLVRGDRVALFMRNAPEHTIVVLGAMAAGLVVVPINAKLADAELDVILEDSGARALVHDGRGARARGPDVVVETGAEFDALLGEGDPGHRPVDVPGDDLAWLFYTSGTTGRPKGAELTHRNLTAMTWALLADVCAFTARRRRPARRAALPRQRPVPARLDRARGRERHLRRTEPSTRTLCWRSWSASG